MIPQSKSKELLLLLLLKRSMRIILRDIFLISFSSDVKMDEKVKNEEDENESDNEDDFEIVINTDAVESVQPGQSSNKTFFRQGANTPGANKYVLNKSNSGQPGAQAGVVGTQLTGLPYHPLQILQPQIMQQRQAGRTLVELDIDSMDEKPWLKPGADPTDYFNYGFTEDTWRAYCLKQLQMKSEIQNLGKIKVFLAY